MKIGIDISPLSSGHKVRGVGSYVSLIKNNIEKYDKENKYIFFEGKAPNDVDIIHYPYFDPFFSMLPFKNKVKTVVTVHDLIPLMHRKNFPIGIRGEIKWQVNKLLLRNVDGIIVDSNASGDDVQKATGIQKNRIFTVYLDVDKAYKPIDDLRAKKEIIERYNLPENFFLYVGDVTWNKNLPRLISATEKVNIPLIMVGKALVDENYNSKNPWNNDRNIINSRINDNSLFVRLGFVPNKDLNIIYNLAIALCMPSLDEGFGLPVLEAMNCGCPVITSRLGSIPEVADEAVLYIDAYDTESLIHAMQEIAKDEKIRRDLRDKGLKQADNFSIRKMVEDTTEIYSKFK